MSCYGDIVSPLGWAIMYFLNCTFEYVGNVTIIKIIKSTASQMSFHQSSADHNVVICSPLPDLISPLRVKSKLCSQAALPESESPVMKVDWQLLYRMSSCTEEFALIQSTIINILGWYSIMWPTGGSTLCNLSSGSCISQIMLYYNDYND